MKQLYKYVTPDSIEIILRNSSIKITNPSEFNDPWTAMSLSLKLTLNY
ncbi:hypothetical protein ACOMICROBIO_NCLOACGD_01505 [Vibrio sp. B1ASS3]|nr:hypothetical protein ACOMICROBIO_NCLOACGD_01505 [Vibrio sp. B1ASS3]CAE6900940.1 hypothetical protein ACOMICROBIO_NCLOACGD_01505 [Vibrio sp. B1ASS3]